MGGGFFGLFCVCLFLSSLESGVRLNYERLAKKKKNLLMEIPDTGKIDTEPALNEVTGKSRSMWRSRGQLRRSFYLLLY